VNTRNLASLSIIKELQTYTAPKAEDSYKVYVQLDGEPLPAGRIYSLTLANGMVQTRRVGVDSTDEGDFSYVLVGPGETATIPNILSGTQFKVWEAAESAVGYGVGYSQTGAEQVSVTDGVSGILRVAAKAVVTVTNTELGTQLEIPVEKTFFRYAQGVGDCTFTLEQTDEQGTVLENGVTLTKTVSINGSTTEFTLGPLNYLKNELETLPGVFWYRIRETGVPEGVLENDQRYLIKVEVTEAAGAQGAVRLITARMTQVLVWNPRTEAYEAAEDGTIRFFNTITGNLTVSKTVDGITSGTSQDFGFTLTLKPGDSGTTPGTLLLTKTTADGTAEQTLTYNGPVTFQLQHGQSVNISGIPFGTAWSVEEHAAGGYNTRWEVDGEAAQAASGLVTTEGSNIHCINTSGYEMPYTGGMGTAMIYALGIVFVMAAGILLAIWKRMYQI
jgi:hypothetical protein